MPAPRKVVKNFSGSAMPAKASVGRAASVATTAGSGTSRPVITGKPRARAASIAGCVDAGLGGGAPIAHDQERLGGGDLGQERRPQRPGRKYLAVAEAASAVDHDHGEILGERRVLETVVQDDDVGAGRDRGARARR